MTTCHWFSVSFPCAYAYVVPVYTYDASTCKHKRMEIIPCLHHTGLHVGFMYLCLCLRRMCKPGFTKLHINKTITEFITKFIVVVTFILEGFISSVMCFYEGFFITDTAIGKHTHVHTGDVKSNIVLGENVCS